MVHRKNIGILKHELGVDVLDPTKFMSKHTQRKVFCIFHMAQSYVLKGATVTNPIE
jgi:hypothetical protein